MNTIRTLNDYGTSGRFVGQHGGLRDPAPVIVLPAKPSNALAHLGFSEIQCILDSSGKAKIVGCIHLMDRKTREGGVNGRFDDARKKKVRSDETLNDAALVERFLGGDIASFDSLVLRHQERVMNLCFRMMGDYDDAKDCAQDTFIKVFRSLGGFRFESGFSTWLYRIAVNTCKNRLASSRERKRLTATQPEFADPPSPFLTPEEEMEKRERESELQRAIGALREDFRTLVVLRDVEGLSYEEVSRITGLALGTVKSKLARARERLRADLRGRL
jgi:RNA polymerase sigma-70 factor (ECF subfamily)